MSELHVVTIVGARPQFIKAAPVSLCIAERDDIRETLVHTGQHYDENMSAIFFEEMGIPEPAYNLEVGSGTHGEQTGKMLLALDGVLDRERPDLVIVYGDTNSTLSGALSAAQHGLPCAHVEAGLRSFNRAMPEEINRVVADSLSCFLFAPTETAVANLLREGASPEDIHAVGDVMLDAACLFRPLAVQKSRALESFGLADRSYVLATVHRAENTDCRDRLAAILEALLRLSADIHVLFPLHPRTRQAVSTHHLQLPSSPRLRVSEPLGYLDMLSLVSSARAVVTDSGGLQKEAFFCEVPCITLRHETEWVELVDSGWNTLAPPTSTNQLVDRIRTALDGHLTAPPGLFGDGNAAARIAAALADRRQE